MHGHVGLLSASLADKPALRGTSVTISGSGLDWHDMESLLRPDGVGRYSFVGDNEIRFNPPGQQYDMVMMMDCSQCPVHPQLQKNFFDTVRKDGDILRRHGVRGALFMSWAYKDKPEMTQQLADQYVRAGRENGMLVIPAGLAFANAIARKPDLELYQPDKRHPSLAGTYLAANTVYATLARKSPASRPLAPSTRPACRSKLRACCSRWLGTRYRSSKKAAELETSGLFARRRTDSAVDKKSRQSGLLTARNGRQVAHCHLAGAVRSRSPCAGWRVCANQVGTPWGPKRRHV